MADRRRKQGRPGGQPAVITGHSPVLNAYYGGDLEKLSELLVADEANLTNPGDTGRPLCFLAARENRKDVLRIIHGVSGDLRYLGYKDGDGENCLFTAIRSNSLRAAQFLLTIGFDPNLTNAHIQTPLHIACIAEDPRLVRLLLHSGADPNIRDDSGNLALHRACQENQPAMVRMLLRHTIDINARGSGNRTALHFAALSQSLELLTLLLAAGASCHVFDSDRRSPMDIVLSLCNLTTITGLAEYFTHRVKGTVSDLESLQHSPEFGEVLATLQAVDDDLENPVEAVSDFHGLQAMELTEDLQEGILQKIRNRERLDFMQFRSLLRYVVSCDMSSILLERSVLPEFAEMVAKQVLYREDLEMLRLLMFGTTLWRNLSAELEKHILTLYNECGELGSTGMQNMRQKSFVDRKTGMVSEPLMLKFFGKFLNMTNMLPCDHEHSDFMRNPIKTLSVWSVLTGRFQLTEDLLKAEQFDILPLGLFCIRLLRRLAKSRQMPRPSKSLMNSVADKIESVCMKLLRAVDSLDVSEKKAVSINYIRQKMPVYSNLTCMSLAAGGECEAFMVMNTVQTAVEREWYQRLFSLSEWRREILILLGVVPYNPLLYFALRITASKDAGDSVLHAHEEAPASKGQDASDGSGPDQGHGHGHGHGHDAGKGEKPLVSIQEEGVAEDHDHDDEHHDESHGDHDEDDHHDEHLDDHHGDHHDDPHDVHVDSLQHDERDGDHEHLITDHGHGHGHGHDEAEARSDGDGHGHGHEHRHGHDEPAAAPTSPTMQAISNYGSTCTEFYLTPCVRFHYHIISHLVFIIMFSYVLLVNFSYQLNVIEIIVYLFILGFFLEELHELNVARQKGSVKSYFQDGWNMIDNFGIATCVLGFCMRMVRLPLAADTSVQHYSFGDDYFWWTRFVLTISCLVFWLRLLYVSTVMVTLGPKLKMISVMITRDLVPFLIMLVIMMFGFGLVIHGLLFPNGYTLGNPNKRTVLQIFKSTFRITFYAMVGDYSMDMITGNDCEKDKRCPHPVGKVVVPNIIMTVYIIIVSILLLNLIVASFSKTVDEIQKKSFAMWQFERYDLLEEFRVRSPLPPPFNIIGELARWLAALVVLLRKRRGGAPFSKTKFNKHRVIKFLTLQAFALRGRRKRLAGELEIDDPDKLLPEIGRQLKKAEQQLQFLQKISGEDEDIEDE